ncbi:CBN-EAK-6 protein [Caenorhabditis brenneri]|uniref:CBN-EAK-6 protein n=1 Tax=Caenorhabditis brenneri TaxID=135651 RepID=G0MFJ1_CAEBE|nr:CBN-EAK-6 protein [Caenorhabditis brenneri]
MPFSKISGVEEVYKYLLEKNILLDRFGLWGLVSQETNVHATQNAISAGHGTTEAERNTELTAVSNVKIYDSRRVKITKSDLNPDGYFDASFLSVPEVNCKYIMTGVPIPSQVPYFWQMVVEQKVPVIVKLTPTIHHLKEYTYFPKQENYKLQCGRYEVKCLKKKSYPSHSYRVLRVSIVSGRDQGHKHDIAHLTLSKWPHEKKFPVADMKQFWKYYTCESCEFHSK